MHVSQLLERVRARPFQSFRIRLANGATHDVRNPHLLMVGRSWVRVGYPAPGFPPDVAANTVQVPLDDIIDLTPLTDLFGVC